MNEGLKRGWRMRRGGIRSGKIRGENKDKGVDKIRNIFEYKDNGDEQNQKYKSIKIRVMIKIRNIREKG